MSACVAVWGITDRAVLWTRALQSGSNQQRGWLQGTPSAATAKDGADGKELRLAPQLLIPDEWGAEGRCYVAQALALAAAAGGRKGQSCVASKTELGSRGSSLHHAHEIKTCLLPYMPLSREQYSAEGTMRRAQLRGAGVCSS